mgnify:CR=1 FL=1
MEAERTEKLCRYCYEPLDPRAKRCPHCRIQQTRLAWLLHPAVLALLMFSPLVFMVATGAFVHQKFGPGKDFSRYRHQLVAVETRMEPGRKDESTVLLVTGKLENRSRIPWEEIETECRFLDADGKLIDVNNDYHSLSVQPGENRSFAITHFPYLPVADYAACEVEVRWATQAE